MNDDFSPQSGGGNTLDHTHKAVLINIWLSADLTEHLLQKQMTNYDEVIEKLFSEASDLENFPQIQDPVVQVYLCVFVLGNELTRLSLQLMDSRIFARKEIVQILDLLQYFFFIYHSLRSVPSSCGTGQLLRMWAQL